MKNGVSLLVVILAISIMLVLISTASIIGTRAIITANFDEFNLTLKRVSDEVNQYYIENNELPIRVENINIASYSELYSYISKKTNDTGANFYVVDLDKLNDNTIQKGRGQTSSLDVFIVAENSHNIYYLAGFTYNKEKYFGLSK